MVNLRVYSSAWLFFTSFSSYNFSHLDHRNVNGLHRQLERDHPGAAFPFLQVRYDPVTDEADLRYLSPRDGFGRFVVGLFAWWQSLFAYFCYSKAFPYEIYIYLDLDRRIRHLNLGQACASDMLDMLAIQHSKGVCYLWLHSVPSAQHASGVVKAIGSFLFGVDVRFEEQDVQGDFSETDVFFWWMISWIFMLVSASSTRMCLWCTILPNTIQYPQLSQGFSNGRGKAWRMAWEPLPGGDLQKTTAEISGRESEYILSL